MNLTSFLKQAPMGAPDRACKLLRAAMSAIESHELRHISQVEFSGLLGISEPTLINWTSRSTQSHQLEALLLLLERLPADQWHGLLKRFLRLCPAIESPVLSHEPSAVSQIRLLVHEKRGLTLIQGGDDAARTFVFTAIGRAVSQMSRPKVTVSGIDIHIPDWFVPIDTVSYIPPPTDKAALILEIKKKWPRLNQGHWHMFNGVWSAAPDCRKDLLAAAEGHHVVVAETAVHQAVQLCKTAGKRRLPIRLITVTVLNDDRIQLDFHHL